MSAPAKLVGPGLVLDLRVRQDALLEVEWYFDLAEAQISPPSNFARMLASANLDSQHRTLEDQVEAVTAHRRIRGWLRAMPNNEAGVLQAAYEPRIWSQAVRVRFGHLAGIAVRLTCALDAWPEDRRLQEAIDMARARDLAAMCEWPEKDTKFLDRVRDKAEARLETAIRAYLRVRGIGRSVIPADAWGPR